MPSKHLIRITLILILVGLIVLTAFNWQRIGNLALKRSLDLLQKSIGAKLSYATVTGDIFRNPTFNQVSLIFSQGDSIYLPKITFYYNPFSLLRGKLSFNIVLTSPEIYLRTNRAKTVKDTLSPPPQLNFPIITIPNLILTDGKFFLNSELFAENLQTTISFHSTKTVLNAQLQKLSFRLTRTHFELKDAKGIFSFDGEEIKIDTVFLLTEQSQAALSGIVNFIKPNYEIKINHLVLNLKELFSQNGTLAAYGKVNLTKTGVKGRVNFFSHNVILNNLALPDLQANLTLAKSSINYFVQTIDKEIESLQLEGSLNLADFSYQGKLVFQNLTPTRFLAIKLPLTPLNGIIDYSGIKTDTVKIQMKSNFSKSINDSIIFNGILNKNKLTIHQIRLIKGQPCFTLDGILAKNKINLNYNLNNLPLTLLNNLFSLKAKGNINGFGTINGNYDSLAVMTDLNLTEFDIEPIHFRQAWGNFILPNIRRILTKRPVTLKNLIERFNFTIDSLLVTKRLIGNLTLSVQDTSFILSIKNSNSVLRTAGVISFDSKSFQGLIDSFSLTSGQETFQAKAPFRIALIDRQFTLTNLNANLAEGELNLNLSLPTQSLPKINLVLKNIDLSKLPTFFGYSNRFYGRADLTLTTNQNYELSFAVTDFKKPAQAIAFDSLTGVMTITDRAIRINKLSLTRNALNSNLSGIIAYFWETKTRKLQIGKLNLQATLADPGIWVLSFLKEMLEVNSGKVYGTIEIKGEMSNPELSGRVVINNAELSIVATATKVEKVNAELLFDRNRIILSKIGGEVEKGKITASGWTELVGLTAVKALFYDINAWNLPIHPQKEIYAVVSGNLQIAYQSNEPTSLKGEIGVQEALLTIGFGQQAEIKSPSTPNLIYNITVKGDRDIWLRNRNCDIELSIDLNIRKTLNETFYSGNLKTRQGNFYYLDHNFLITEGEIKFDNINELSPNLHLIAERYTRPMKINSNTPERIKIKLQLSGTLKEPIFNFTAEPSVLSQEDIISYLTLNVTPQEISVAEQREIFNKLVSERFLGYFEREIAKKFRNYIKLDYLQFESGLLEGGKTAKVTVGKYIAQNLYATYTHNISGLTQDRFRIEYYLTKSQELIGERDEQGRYRLKYQFKFRY